jgi:hypothetical protein
LETERAALKFEFSDLGISSHRMEIHFAPSSVTAAGQSRSMTMMTSEAPTDET